MKIFDGKTTAEQREALLKTKVAELAKLGKSLRVAAVLFTEDVGSTLYTRLKKEAAERVGIDYQVATFSMLDSSELVVEHIEQLNQDSSITGIIIQKPWRMTWQEVNRLEGQHKDIRQAFQAWWSYLTSQIDLKKDVDGLHPQTLAAIEDGTWQEKKRVMPATAKAVLEILQESQGEAAAGLDFLQNKKIIIIGKSDILGKPLYLEFKNKKFDVEMIGSKGLTRRMEHGHALLDADVIISATGRKHLITGEMVKAGVVVIDVGEPRPDVEFATVSEKASFITPVPNGVGPMTVVSLLENVVELSF
jgi:methylenetetrahydrofolate dehydrogenase (NADP+) / methenyltetrahydrofolate cyclohydrolase